MLGGLREVRAPGSLPVQLLEVGRAGRRAECTGSLRPSHAGAIRAGREQTPSSVQGFLLSGHSQPGLHHATELGPDEKKPPGCPFVPL